MARTLFHKMTLYQKKMAEKQLLINRFVQIGTELFIMSAVCSYADSLRRDGGEATNAEDLAAYYCREAKLRIRQLFSDIGRNNDKATLKLNSKFMDGKFEWLEDEILVDEKSATAVEDATASTDAPSEAVAATT